ncbi:beta-1,4-glucuronyltransferase 1 isoform X1 [Rhodnius prolixus]
MASRRPNKKRSPRHSMPFAAILQLGSRLWNVSAVSILVLTSCNVVLMLRLLQTECSGDLPSRPQPPPMPPAILDLELRHTLTVTNTTPIFSADLQLGRWDTTRTIKMVDHVVVGDDFRTLSSRYSVCLATQSSVERLHSLVEVAHHWTGPISAALFAAGDDEFSILQGYVEFLRRCYAPVRERVSFHVAFPKERLPTQSFMTEKISGFDCAHPEASLQELLHLRTPETVRWRLRNPYPQNHLRNLARKNCQTSHVFLTDVDIVPSLDLAQGVDIFLKAETCKRLCAYVVPTYELDPRVTFPPNKSELVRLTTRGLARPFHHKVFIYNQFATNFSRWEQDLHNAAVHISHSVTNFEFLYEPFYIAPDTVPPHDERFIGYGFTRNTQVYEMFVVGYEFLVLSPVFTIHWGLQNRKGRPSWRERQNTNNRKNFDQFKREVFARYNKDPLNMVVGRTKEQNTNIRKAIDGG